MLKVRQKAEEFAQKALGMAKKELREQQKILDDLKKEVEDVEKEFSRQRKKVALAQTLTQYSNYLKKVRRKIFTQEDNLMRLGNIVEAKRKEVVTAQKEKKALENIRKKQFLLWRKNIETKEAKALDELATIKYKKGKKQPL
ncbi:flagellar export protein FliJ [Simkania negevensis]|uniref:Flagellar FliJ protein n=1 Tax=Simkania negevensis TaxID=83561 RepID=A0ABS3AQZ9_9BACT|nr:flagellar export protein FliJ [Simkania negevensis]